MKIQFDSEQSYQKQAIETIVQLFEGQPHTNTGFEISFTHNVEPDGQTRNFDVDSIFANDLKISDEQLLQNAQKIQKQHNLLDANQCTSRDFSVEMETGTGKTYVYLRMMYELNKMYGFKKFVIVVPSIAIKEGVKKNLQITLEHFQKLYENEPCNYYVYDSQRPTELRTYATTNSLQILVINIDSFAKDENVINKTNDKLNGKTPIEFIQKIKPIVIIDEPQNMETEKRKKAIENLNPLCTLRFSATHRNTYNQIYKLDPVKAYELGLVKQIEVTSVLTQNDNNQAFIRLDSFVKNKKTKLEAKITIDCNTLLGVTRKQVTVSRDVTNLYDLSGKREMYYGFQVKDINPGENFIEFSNNIKIFAGQTLGGFTEEIMKKQIEKAVETHFKKERKLREKGIKVLTVFFIDRVANYRFYDEQGNAQKGKFARWFEEYFNFYNEKEKLYDFEVDRIHDGYFSQDKHKHFIESKFSKEDEDNSTKADAEAYDLIMKDKERLLDNAEPLRFIFSHSALREGWDNPNVFQICTLNETKSDMKKRQEIGRGLRLCVNSEGKRTDENGEIYGREINRLTVIANESYKDFCTQLQNQYRDEGYDYKHEIVENADEPKIKVKLKDNYDLDQNFKAIWDKIKQKTQYKIKYSTEELIKNASENMRNMPEISNPKIVIENYKFNDAAGFDVDVTSSQQEFLTFTNVQIPDYLNYIESKTQLTRKTISEILKQSGRLPEIFKNPQVFMDNVVIEIKKALTALMIEGIEYEKIEKEYYNQQLFENENEQEFVREIIEKHYKKVENQDKTLYNYIKIDSQVEAEFAKKCETVEQVPFYFKLPSWFKIRTPIGNYNPDWALFRNDHYVYFVAETKGNRNNLRTDEGYKVHCGEKHFEKFKNDNVKYVIAEKFDDVH